MEKDLCRALCQLRRESDAKTVVKQVLSVCTTSQAVSPDFKSIRESILQVIMFWIFLGLLVFLHLYFRISLVIVNSPASVSTLFLYSRFHFIT